RVERCLFIALGPVGSLTVPAAAQTGSRLIDAVKRQDVQTVRSLLAARADVKATEADGSTALHWAVKNNHLQLTEMLLSAGADVRRATRYRITPLYFACLNGNATMIEGLLKAGDGADAGA